MIKQLTILYLFLNFVFIKANDLCLNLDVYITQKIENEGFHREINWIIETSNPNIEDWLQSECNMALRLEVPSGMYVNPDEVAELNSTDFSIRINNKVDIEAVMHESREYKIMIYLNNTKINRISVNLPIHMRYQRAQLAGGYSKVLFKKPSVLTWCSGENKLCQKGLKIEAPCGKINKNICVWNNVTYKGIVEDSDLFVPVGDLDHFPFVSVITLLLGCGGTIYILSLLSTAPL